MRREARPETFRISRLRAARREETRLDPRQSPGVSGSCAFCPGPLPRAYDLSVSQAKFLRVNLPVRVCQVSVTLFPRHRRCELYFKRHEPGRYRTRRESRTRSKHISMTAVGKMDRLCDSRERERIVIGVTNNRRDSHVARPYE